MTWLWATWQVSYEKQELLIIRKNMGSPLVLRYGPCSSTFKLFSVVSVSILISFLSYTIYVSMLSMPGFPFGFHYHSFILLLTEIPLYSHHDFPVSQKPLLRISHHYISIYFLDFVELIIVPWIHCMYEIFKAGRKTFNEQ